MCWSATGPRKGASRAAWPWGDRSPSRAEPSSSSSDAVLEPLRLREGLELLQRVVLDRPDSLACHSEGPPDLLERARLRAGEPEAELDHLPLALRERRQRVRDVL